MLAPFEDRAAARPPAGQCRALAHHTAVMCLCAIRHRWNGRCLRVDAVCAELRIRKRRWYDLSAVLSVLGMGRRSGPKEFEFTRDTPELGGVAGRSPTRNRVGMAAHRVLCELLTHGRSGQRTSDRVEYTARAVLVGMGVARRVGRSLLEPVGFALV